MAHVGTYADVLKSVIRRYAEIKPSYGAVDVETVLDDAGGHYELMYSGWIGDRRVHGSVIHADIRGDKIWIQHDGTESGIAEDLVEAGVPRDHIVLAFRHPDERKHTSFAVD